MNPKEIQPGSVLWLMKGYQQNWPALAVVFDCAGWEELTHRKCPRNGHLTGFIPVWLLGDVSSPGRIIKMDETVQGATSIKQLIQDLQVMAPLLGVWIDYTRMVIPQLKMLQQYLAEASVERLPECSTTQDSFMDILTKGVCCP